MPGAAPSLAAADRAAVARAGFPAFVELASPHVPGVERYLRGRHQRVIAEQFEALVDGECDTLLVNIPPGHMKSTIVSVEAPAWLWTKRPEFAILCASHSEVLVNGLGDTCRGLIESRWYRERWGDILVDSRAVKRLVTYAGGYRLAGTVRGGSLVGRHGALFVVDDPLDPDAGDSAAGKNLENAKSWLRQKVLTRGKVGYTMKLAQVMQRLHVDDPSGYLIEVLGEDPRFRHVMLPYEFEADHASPYDWRTVEGEELWPEAKKGPDMARLALASGGVLGETYRSHAQQDPSSGKDKIFPGDCLTNDLGGVRPQDCELLVMSVDPTFTAKKTSDDCAIEVWGMKQMHMYCFYSDHAKRGFNDSLAAIRAVRAQWRPMYTLVEAAANGNAIAETLEREMAIIRITPGSEGKATRARGISPVVTAKHLHFDTSAKWYAEKVRLLIRFTGAAGGKDDTVDTTTQAVHWLLQNGGGMAALIAAMSDPTIAQEARAFGLEDFVGLG